MERTEDLGVIHSGPQWLQSVRGGRATDQTIPPVLIVAATGPGRLLVTAGAVTLAELRNGALSGREVDVFQAQWLHERLSDVGQLTWAAHMRDREQAGEPWAEVHSTFVPCSRGMSCAASSRPFEPRSMGNTDYRAPRPCVRAAQDGRYVREVLHR